MSDWPAPGLYVVTLPDDERTLACFRKYDAMTIPRQTYWHRGDDVPLTDVVPVTPAPTAALDALRDAFTCEPGNDEDFVSDQAAIDFINAVDALDE